MNFSKALAGMSRSIILGSPPLVNTNGDQMNININTDLQEPYIPERIDCEVINRHTKAVINEKRKYIIVCFFSQGALYWYNCTTLCHEK